MDFTSRISSLFELMTVDVTFLSDRSPDTTTSPTVIGSGVREKLNVRSRVRSMESARTLNPRYCTRIV